MTTALMMTLRKVTYKVDKTRYENTAKETGDFLPRLW